MGLMVIFTTCRDKNEAKQIAGTLVSEGHVACAVVMASAESHYIWEGKQEWTEEVPLLLKTLPEKVEGLRARLTELHSYDIPAFAAWPADSSDAYEAWVRVSCTSP